jgi:hypothetical protein
MMKPEMMNEKREFVSSSFIRDFIVHSMHSAYSSFITPMNSPLTQGRKTALTSSPSGLLRLLIAAYART